MEGGVLGRIDDMLIVRGNNVFPSAVEGVLREIPEVAEFRLTPTVRGAMTDLRIEVELAEGADTADTADAARRIVDRVRDRLNFAPTVEIVESGALPRFEMKARRVRKDGI